MGFQSFFAIIALLAAFSNALDFSCQHPQQAALLQSIPVSCTVADNANPVLQGNFSLQFSNGASIPMQFDSPTSSWAAAYQIRESDADLNFKGAVKSLSFAVSDGIASSRQFSISVLPLFPDFHSPSVSIQEPLVSIWEYFNSAIPLQAVLTVVGSDGSVQNFSFPIQNSGNYSQQLDTNYMEMGGYRFSLYLNYSNGSSLVSFENFSGFIVDDLDLHADPDKWDICNDRHVTYSGTFAFNNGTGIPNTLIHYVGGGFSGDIITNSTGNFMLSFDLPQPVAFLFVPVDAIVSLFTSPPLDCLPPEPQQRTPPIVPSGSSQAVSQSMAQQPSQPTVLANRQAVDVPVQNFGTSNELQSQQSLQDSDVVNSSNSDSEVIAITINQSFSNASFSTGLLNLPFSRNFRKATGFTAVELLISANDSGDFVLRELLPKELEIDYVYVVFEQQPLSFEDGTIVWKLNSSTSSFAYYVPLALSEEDMLLFKPPEVLPSKGFNASPASGFSTAGSPVTFPQIAIGAIAVIGMLAFAFIATRRRWR